MDSRLGFIALLEYCAAHDVGIVLAENASRFARDLIVQLIGHALLRERDIELIPVDAPSHFTDPTPTAEMVRQIRAPSASSRRSAWWPSCVMPASG